MNNHKQYLLDLHVWNDDSEDGKNSKSVREASRATNERIPEHKEASIEKRQWSVCSA